MLIRPMAAGALALAAAFLTLAGAQASAQARAQVAGTPPAALKVLLDCDGDACDFDFFRTEMRSVDWVRDRAVGDVHLLVSSQNTGAGGDAYTVAFLGRGQFDGLGDTLVYVAGPTAVDDAKRRGLAQVFRVGLVPFIARASGYDAVTIDFRRAQTAAQAGPIRDPWNNWVFEISLDGSTEGDRTSSELNSEGEIRAARVTDGWKTRIKTGGSYDANRFELSDGETFTNTQRNYNVEFEHVKSVGDHVAVGLTGGIGSSTFSNQKRVVKLASALEYDFFPYSEVTSRQITVQYAVGLTHYVYEDTTVFLKIREGVPVQQLRAEISARQPWGNVSVTGLFRNQVRDATKRRASIGGNADINILRGLSLDFGGEVSSIHDQINLRLEEATDEEILVRQRERATSYRFEVYFGISYTFGSIFNNVVNPRFDLGDFF